VAIAQAAAAEAQARAAQLSKQAQREDDRRKMSRQVGGPPLMAGLPPAAGRLDPAGPCPGVVPAPGRKRR
jgi:hypothetical protein